MCWIFFSIFIVWWEWKWWHLAATFHQHYCYSLVVGICFPSGEKQRRCPRLEEHRVKESVGKYFQMPCTTLLLKFLGWDSTSQQNNVLARYVHLAKLPSTVQRNNQSWCSDATERKEQAGDSAEALFLDFVCATLKSWIMFKSKTFWT